MTVEERLKELRGKYGAREVLAVGVVIAEKLDALIELLEKLTKEKKQKKDE